MGGARGLRRATKVRSVVSPAVAHDPTGPSADPHSVAQHELQIYRKLWRTTATPPIAWIPDRPSFPRADPGEVRR
eukprot:795031-Pyramimonas_sp.AAC.1